MDNLLRIELIIKELDRLYPVAECSLNYANVLQLLISTQLSAQSTDARVNMITPALFARYPTARDFAVADLPELENYIYSIGCYHTKAKNIKECCATICEVFDGNVPATMEELLTLPGVGRKTANLVLGDAFGQPSYVVDTHTMRLCRRIGLTRERTPDRIEMDLRVLLPANARAGAGIGMCAGAGKSLHKSSRFCHQLVLHGRSTCKSRKPNCAQCAIYNLCDRVGVEDN